MTDEEQKVLRDYELDILDEIMETIDNRLADLRGEREERENESGWNCYADLTDEMLNTLIEWVEEERSDAMTEYWQIKAKAGK